MKNHLEYCVNQGEREESSPPWYFVRRGVSPLPAIAYGFDVCEHFPEHRK